MEATYKIGFWDMVWFNFYQMPRMLSGQVSIGIIALVVGYIIFSAFGENTDTTFPTWINFLSYVVVYIVVLVTILLAILVLTFLVHGFIYMTSPSQRQQTKKECKLLVSENGVISETTIGRSEIKWSGIVKIRQSRNYILFYFSERAALVLPKRVFVNRADAEEFFNYSYQIWERAKNAGASQNAA